MYRIVCSLLVALLAACSWAPEIEEGSSTGVTASGPRTAIPASVTTGRKAVQVALDQLGTPYAYGGERPGGFDCSGLVKFSYATVGVKTPRTTSALWRWTTPIPRDALRPGDILFFEIEGKPSHVGLYMGEDRFVHAPSSGGNVSIRHLDDPFYRPRFLRGGRLPFDP